MYPISSLLNRVAQSIENIVDGANKFRLAILERHLSTTAGLLAKSRYEFIREVVRTYRESSDLDIGLMPVKQHKAYIKKDGEIKRGIENYIEKLADAHELQGFEIDYTDIRSSTKPMEPINIHSIRQSAWNEVLNFEKTN